MACFAFASFALVDLYMIDTSVLPLYALRATLIVLNLLIYRLCNGVSMRRHAYSAGASVCILTGVGVVLLTDMTGGPSSLYWTMIMLVFFTASLIMPFRPIQAAGVFASIAFFYDVWMLLQGVSTSSSGWILSNAGIWLSAFVSVLAVVYIDDLRDREDADRQRLEQLNSKLRQEIAEREKMEGGLRRSQQLDAVGRLAAGLAHELNNALLIISSSAELIQRNPEQPRKYADRILESAHRGARLTADMLLFARKGRLENKIFSLNKVVSDVSEVFAATQKMSAKIETDLAPGDAFIAGDSQLISQALLNLYLNGVDAMQNHGTLSIKTELQEESVLLTVRDDGKGMNPQEMERAFEPFFTTKSPGKGTGLGLSMVYGIIKDHDGSISIESILGQGTSVLIELPTTTKTEENQASYSEPSPAELPNAQLLLVEDDRMVRQLMTETLQNSGFKVRQANNGVEAYQAVRQANPPFDLIIMDMVMPEMDGQAAYDLIRADSSTQRVLLYSGHSPGDQLPTMLKNPNTQFLQKPFRQADLLDSIGLLLNERE